MSTLDELERELGPALRTTLDEMIAGPDTDPQSDDAEGIAPAGRRPGPARLVEANGATAARRHVWVAAVAAVIAVATVGAIAWTRQSESSVQTDTGTETTLVDSTATSLPTETSPAVTDTGLSWVLSTDTGSLARSTVNGVVAGPTGFVATGMGFDDQRNQGRVWFSPDGLSWEEPALQIFDTLAVSNPVATSTAFFVTAATNTDRTPESEGEGQPTLPDAHLYRSVDGVTWERWGELLGEMPVGLTSVGDGLLRSSWSPDHSDIVEWWSADGVDWAPAEFAGHLPGTRLDLNDKSVVTLDGRVYLAGWLYSEARTMFVVWASDDGRTWEALPSPPSQGVLALAADDLILVAPAPTRATYRYDPIGQQWSEVVSGDRGAPATPDGSMQRIVQLDGLLVAPTALGPDGSMTVWTSSSTNIAWQPDPASTLDLGPLDGTGFVPGAASLQDRVVIAVPMSNSNGTIIQVGAHTSLTGPGAPPQDAPSLTIDPTPTTSTFTTGSEPTGDGDAPPGSIPPMTLDVDVATTDGYELSAELSLNVASSEVSSETGLHVSRAMSITITNTGDRPLGLRDPGAISLWYGFDDASVDRGIRLGSELDVPCYPGMFGGAVATCPLFTFRADSPLLNAPAASLSMMLDSGETENWNSDSDTASLVQVPPELLDALESFAEGHHLVGFSVDYAVATESGLVTTTTFFDVTGDYVGQCSDEPRFTGAFDDIGCLVDASNGNPAASSTTG